LPFGKQKQNLRATHVVPLVGCFWGQGVKLGEQPVLGFLGMGFALFTAMGRGGLPAYGVGDLKRNCV